MPVRPRASLLVSLALCLGGSAAAQTPFEQTYLEVTDRITELPRDAAPGDLSTYELARLTYRPPDTAAVVRGYAPARGLYTERTRLNPRAGLPEWRGRVPAVIARERDRSYVLDEDGEVLYEATDYTSAPELAGYEQASSELRPYVETLFPTPTELAQLRRDGRVVGERRATARTRELPRPGTGLAVPATLVLSDGETTFTIDTVSRVTTATEYHPDGSVAHFEATQYRSATLASGKRVLLVARRLEIRPDTLFSGVPVRQTVLRKRTGYTYTRAGVEQLGGPPHVGAEALAVFPNPLTEGHLTVALPDGVAGAPWIRLHDPAGRLVFERRFGSTGAGLLPVALPDDLPAGPYALTVVLGSRSWTRSIIAH